MDPQVKLAIPIAIAVILGELLLVFVITTIVFAGSASDTTTTTTSSSSSASSSGIEPPTYAVSFTEFMAETFSVTFLKEGGYRMGNSQKEYVFSPFKWFEEAYYEDGIFSRVFSTDDDDSTTVCMNMSSHSYCYRQTDGTEGGFQILYNVPIKQFGISCYKKFPELETLLPSRILDKCDLYISESRDPNVFSLRRYSFKHDTFYYWLVESDTNYPVMEQIKYSGEGYSTMKLFSDFKPGKPSDESGLKPLPGVTTVYDFRDGEGDVGECKFDLDAALKDRTDNPYVNSRRRNKLVREFLNMPLLGISPITPSRVRDSPVVRDASSIPKEFDARTYFSDCSEIIGTITNQDICGSCWAMASAGVFSDRLCIEYGIKAQLSPQYMVYCGKRSDGCQGGQTIPAWDDLIDQGTVSEECIPFTGRDGKCPTVCKDYSPVASYKIHATGYVFPWGDTNQSRVEAIQTEIMTHGPVMASFICFNDFQPFFEMYPYGVYHRSKEATDGGGHAVRIIGWGTSEEGEDYWLVANSWGIVFAEDGVFRIRRGINECNIEEEVGGLLV